MRELHTNNKGIDYQNKQSQAIICFQSPSVEQVIAAALLMGTRWQRLLLNLLTTTTHQDVHYRVVIYGK
jgi:hypothetical protein